MHNNTKYTSGYATYVQLLQTDLQVPCVYLSIRWLVCDEEIVRFNYSEVQRQCRNMQGRSPSPMRQRRLPEEQRRNYEENFLHTAGCQLRCPRALRSEYSVRSQEMKIAIGILNQEQNSYTPHHDAQQRVRQHMRQKRRRPNFAAEGCRYIMMIYLILKIISKLITAFCPCTSLIFETSAHTHAKPLSFAYDLCQEG